MHTTSSTQAFVANVCDIALWFMLVAICVALLYGSCFLVRVGVTKENHRF